jgi:hypothetical protein
MKTKNAGEIVAAVKGLVASYPTAVYEKKGKGGCGNISGNVIVDGKTVMTGCVVGCAVTQCEGAEGEAYEWMTNHDNYPVGELLRGIQLATIDDDDLVWLCAIQDAQDNGYAWKQAANKADEELKTFQACDKHDRAGYVESL